MAILYAEDGTNKDDTIIGSANDDVINAGNGNDLVFGNAGNDRLLGGNGSDRVFGGSGSDIIGTLNADATLRNAGSGDNGGDTLYGDGFENWEQYKNASGGVGNTASVTTATSSDVIYGGNGKDTIWGDNGNNATGTGAGGADIIYAGNGVDTVYGEGGNDVLVGENGADVLYGGSGSDFFVYNAVNESSGSGFDTIKDFSEFKDANTADNDKIDLRPLLAGGFGQVAGGSYNSDNSDATDAAKLNWGGMDPIAKGVWFKHVDTNGDSIADTTMVYADTDGNLLTGTDGGAELVIKLEGIHHLTNNDFLGVKNAAPTLAAEAAGTLTDTAVYDDFGNLSGQLDGSDPDFGAVLTYSLAPGEDGISTYGTLTVNADGTYTFVPNDAAINGLDSGAVENETFSVQVSDGITSTTANLTVTLNGVNDAPVIAGDLTGEINEGGSYTLTAADLGEDDPDDSGADLTYTVSNLANGVIEVDGVEQLTFTAQDVLDGKVVFIHDGSETLSAGFDVSLADGLEDGAVADTDSFSFTVTPVNDAPVNTVGARTVTEDVLTAITGVSVSDTDNNIAHKLSTVQLTVLHGTLNVTLVGAATISAGANSSGTLTLSGSVADINATLASLKYQSVLNYNGNDTLTMLSTDAAGASDSDTVAITVTAANDQPVATNDTIIVSNSTLVTIPVSALLANDTDIDGLALTLSLTPAQIAAATGITNLTLNPNGTISFTSGSTTGSTAGSFQYTVSDGAGGTTTGSVTIDIRNTDNQANPIILSGNYQASYIDGRGGADPLTGTAPGDTFIGSGGADILNGGAGNDLLIGGDNNDVLNGDAGDDILRGGVGNNDVMDGGAGIDLLDFSDGSSALTSAFVFNQGDNGGGFWTLPNATAGLGNGDQYKNMEGVIGTSFGDVINGSGSSDIIRGGGGNDIIDGGLGVDIIDFSDATAAINFTLNQDTNVGGFWTTGALAGIGNDSYKNMEGVTGSAFNDTLTGSSGPDVLNGGGGNDSIVGGVGDDTIIGGSGADTMTGGAGSDTFAWRAGDASAVDTITDFAAGLGGDALDIRDLLSGYTAGNIGQFVSVRESGGNTIVSVDRDASGTAYGYQDLVVLTGVTGVTVDTLKDNGNLINS